MNFLKTFLFVIAFIIGIFYPLIGLANDELVIEVNVAENSLSIIKSGKLVERYHVSTGRKRSPSPIGHFKVIEKSKDWGGGFGTRWLGLNVPWGIYGIHGTNKPDLIGKNVSSGCIRMKNKDVERLYDQIPVGTPVHITGLIPGLEDHVSVLAVGSKGTLVYLVQQRLKLAGYYYGNVNGIYDINTEKAVEHYQKDHHLIVTGHGNQQLYLALGLLE